MIHITMERYLIGTDKLILFAYKTILIIIAYDSPAQIEIMQNFYK